MENKNRNTTRKYQRPSAVQRKKQLRFSLKGGDDDTLEDATQITNAYPRLIFFILSNLLNIKDIDSPVIKSFEAVCQSYGLLSRYVDEHNQIDNRDHDIYIAGKLEEYTKNIITAIQGWRKRQKTFERNTLIERTYFTLGYIGIVNNEGDTPAHVEVTMKFLQEQDRILKESSMNTKAAHDSILHHITTIYQLTKPYIVRSSTTKEKLVRDMKEDIERIARRRQRLDEAQRVADKYIESALRVTSYAGPTLNRKTNLPINTRKRATNQGRAAATEGPVAAGAGPRAAGPRAAGPRAAAPAATPSLINLMNRGPKHNYFPYRSFEEKQVANIRREIFQLEGEVMRLQSDREKAWGEKKNKMNSDIKNLKTEIFEKEGILIDMIADMEIAKAERAHIMSGKKIARWWTGMTKEEKRLYWKLNRIIPSN